MDATKRLLSLDLMRGIIMVLLMLESTRLYDHLLELSDDGGWFHGLMTQFTHHPWNGLRFWDLIQPGFMFMAGTAMALSLHRQELEGVPWSNRFFKTLRRSGWLFFWGVLDYAVRDHGLSFELWDVLTQLSFTTLVAFFLFQYRPAVQICVSLGLLLLTELLYRYTGVPGFDQPFTDQHNFGNYMDLLLMNKINQGGWVAINCLPTAAHTIWGVLAGKLLLSETDAARKIRTLVIGGMILLVSGYVLDFLSVTPIIKRIATSSFTLASGGWVLLLLALIYWYVDIKNNRSRLGFFTVVGMNPLFIYLFFEIVANRWFNGYITAIVSGLLVPAGLSEGVALVMSSVAIFILEWRMCKFLFDRKIFFRV